MDEFKSLKAFLRGTAIDAACIAAMLMQVFSPHDSLIWFLGNVGYAMQVIFVATALVMLPLILLGHFAIRRIIENQLPQASDPKLLNAAAALTQLQDRPVLYQRLAMGREILICLVFAGFGWIWLAIGNLVALWLMTLVWGAPRIDVAKAA